MSFFSRINRRSTTAKLVLSGLHEQQRLDRRAISNVIHLLAGALGSGFEDLDPRAAAGMVLLALAKNSTLGSCLNDSGWAHVFALTDAQPDIAARLSPAASFEIASRRSLPPGPAMARAA